MLGLYPTCQRDANLILAASQEYASGFLWIYMSVSPIDLRFKYESEMLLSWESMPPQCPPLEVSWIKVFTTIDYIINRASLSSLSPCFLGGASGFFGQDNWADGSPLLLKHE